jgi:transcriptional regulator with XRE-family HTH domain
VSDEHQRERAEVGMRVQELMKRTRFTLLQWAQAADVPHTSARAWASGGRTPEPENIDALADGLERFARDVLLETAADLRKVAQEHRGGSA